jgi:cysteinyl-tRNA synthetase
MNEHPARTLTPTDAASIVDALRVVNEVFAVVAIEERPTLVVPDHIRALAEERWAARTAKNWSESDRLREMLSASGWTMNDGKDGYTLESSK